MKKHKTKQKPGNTSVNRAFRGFFLRQKSGQSFDMSGGNVKTSHVKPAKGKYGRYFVKLFLWPNYKTLNIKTHINTQIALTTKLKKKKRTCMLGVAHTRIYIQLKT